MKKGRSNSINGTMINTENGTNLNKSLVVRINCLYSRLDRDFPFRILHISLAEMRTSINSSLNPW